MSSGQSPPAHDRSEQVAYVSNELLPRVALLTRLLARQLRGGLSRSEAGLMNTLSAGPRRITELAELEGLAQPTMTLLVKRLEQRRWVRREADASDGRVVLVSITLEGMAAFEVFRARVSAILREYLSEMSAGQIEALATTTDAIPALITLLQQGGAR
jgi:DNA-binding MarR family transcriptional regulator